MRAKVLEGCTYVSTSCNLDGAHETKDTIVHRCLKRYTPSSGAYEPFLLAARTSAAYVARAVYLRKHRSLQHLAHVAPKHVAPRNAPSCMYQPHSGGPG